MLRLSKLSKCFHSSRCLKKEIAFRLADIGEGIAEVEVMQWFVKEGDSIQQFQNVCEVQSDKATVEITSRYDGKVTKIHHSIGEMAQVGSTLIDIDVADDIAAAHESQSMEDTVDFAKDTPDLEEEAPDLTEEDTVDLTEEDTVDVANSSTIDSSTKESSTIETTGSKRKGEKILTTPSVRRLGKEHGLDLKRIDGTGPGGRLLKADVLEYIKQVSSGKIKEQGSSEEKEQQGSSGKQEQQVSSGYLEKDEVVAVRGVQRLMVKSMNAALLVPHFGYADEVEMDALKALREVLKPMAELKGVSVSYMPFMIKAASLALKEYPILNSRLSECEGEYTMLKDHNISVAMDTPKGLIVPNIKRVQDKSIMDIAMELKRLQELGNAGKLSEKDLTHGTFSISNIGNLGGTYLNPVIMVPQVAIGAIGKIQKVPKFNPDETIRVCHQMHISWSGDHRIIDGATMARFSNLWKSYLENPTNMLTQMH